jgi:DNA-binding MarR family transcriptional regulator
MEVEVNPTAQTILSRLAAAARDGIKAPSAQGMARDLGVTTGAVSYHLRVLTQEKRVKREHCRQLRRNVWVVVGVGRTG